MPRHPANLHGPLMLTEPGELVDVRVDFRDLAVSDIFRHGGAGIRLVIIDRDGNAGVVFLTVRREDSVEIETPRDERKPVVERCAPWKNSYRTTVYPDLVLNASTVDEFQKVKS